MRERLRTLRIDGDEFTWKAEIRHVRSDDDCHRCIRVRAWGDGKNSRALQVDLLSKSPSGPWGACATDGVYPTTHDVRALIGHALTDGWDPAVRGGTFHLAGATVILDEFVVTEGLPDSSRRGCSPKASEGHLHSI
jgi:hypothetical protein